ncbi:DUF6708 domain-containing protein [Xenorhabdus sp. PB30.3]|uniref:DUF6708 domain-containing protein n=1 Tax=Xenorhabdus sp. PB30.3 TaxID=2788941 RepID=UPI001E30AEE0|nr:DUF6708 domain-containing protein [Xenorhabdus sp. PB30.3]MCC8381226.1 hypothetical protein [Xenorhabdus sp. PB30.3]
MSHLTGLFTPYSPPNRSLTEQEKRERLYQGQLHPDNPLINDNDTVIKMNSTYLETVDKHYSVKGFPSLISFGIAVTLLCIMGFGSYRVIEAHHLRNEPLGYSLLVINSIIGLIIFVSLKITLKEWFIKTHYPIRFNRKNKMVYIFQVDGTVLSVPWDSVFFTITGGNKWGIVGHILADDNERILKTFNLAIFEPKSNLPGYWEFIRCYMEEDVLKQIQKTIFLCPPISERKEGYIFGLQYLTRVDTKYDWIFRLPFFLYSMLEAFSRYIAMQTSKIPQWPEEVERECQIDFDDPIDVSYKNNIPYVWRYVLAGLKKKDHLQFYKQRGLAVRRIRRKVTRHHKAKE